MSSGEHSQTDFLGKGVVTATGNKTQTPSNHTIAIKLNRFQQTLESG